MHFFSLGHTHNNIFYDKKTNFQIKQRKRFDGDSGNSQKPNNKKGYFTRERQHKNNKDRQLVEQTFFVRGRLGGL